VHVVPVQVGVPVLVSQAFPQPPQLVGVVVAVSQPSRSGAAFVQSAQPAAQPWYWQVVPLQVGEWLVVVSQTLPQPAQLVGVVVAVSHPFRSGAVVWQSAQPAAQLA
jgi:hypothetical protein